MPYGFNDDKSKYDMDDLINGVRTVAKGGTGASTAAAARSNLGIYYGNGTVLFDDDSNSAMNIELEESAENFDKLVICYRTNLNEYGSVEVWHPNGKTVALSVIGSYTDNFVWLKHVNVTVDGEYIQQESWSHQVQITPSGLGYYEAVDIVYITQVIGYTA